MTSLMKISYSLFCIMSALIFLGLQTSCETTDGSDLQVFITPPGATVSNNEKVQFTASGGRDYQWSLSDSSLGFLSTRTGKQTLYTANAVTPTGSVSVIQILTLSASVTTADRPASSNGLPAVAGETFTFSAEAVIEHSPSPASPGGTTDPISIAPLGVTLNEAGQQTFTVAGQGPDYTWSISNAAFGDINPKTGDTTIYTYDGLAPAGTTVTITVTSNGQSTQASVFLDSIF